MPLPLLRTGTTLSFARISRRSISTLPSDPHIYFFPQNKSPSSSYTLSLLPSDPPTGDLALGTTTSIPPTPDSFYENPKFINLLQLVLQKYAHQDPGVISQAQVFASTAGSSLGSGGAFSRQRTARRHSNAGAGAGGDGAGGASAQGGAGGAGRGGWVHLSDSRNPPDYGRIAWPEDIFGSLQVDGKGIFVGETGEYQPSGTYRIFTREGILGLSDFLRGKVIERLQEEEEAIRSRP